MTTTNNKWYIIQVIPNHELVVKENLENRVFEEENTGIQEVFLPFTVATTKTGVKKKKPMFPGYLFVKVEMTDNSWYIIRNTQYVTGIVGSSGQRTKPTPIPDSQVTKILKRIEQEQLNEITLADQPDQIIKDPSFKLEDVVEIKTGNFKEQFGRVKEISIEKQIAVVEVEFFGRMTPVTISLKDLAKK